MNINGFIPADMLSKLQNMSIGSDNNTSSIDSVSGTSTNGSSDTSSLDFSSILKDKLNEVNDKQMNSDNITNQFISGEDVDVHQVMLSAQEAQMSLQLAVQMRNKIVESYQELNRMQV